MCEQFTAIQILMQHQQEASKYSFAAQEHKSSIREASEHNSCSIRVSFRTESEEKTSNQKEETA
jgi:hypothetical protein